MDDPTSNRVPTPVVNFVIQKDFTRKGQKSTFTPSSNRGSTLEPEEPNSPKENTGGKTVGSVQEAPNDSPGPTQAHSKSELHVTSKGETIQETTTRIPKPPPPPPTALQNTFLTRPRARDRGFSLSVELTSDILSRNFQLRPTNASGLPGQVSKSGWLHRTTTKAKHGAPARSVWCFVETEAECVCFFDDNPYTVGPSHSIFIDSMNLDAAKIKTKLKKKDKKMEYRIVVKETTKVCFFCGDLFPSKLIFFLVTLICRHNLGI
jgi:hypothetical protein